MGKWLDGPAAGGLGEEEREEEPTGPLESRKSSGGIFNVFGEEVSREREDPPLSAEKADVGGKRAKTAQSALRPGALRSGVAIAARRRGKGVSFQDGREAGQEAVGSARAPPSGLGAGRKELSEDLQLGTSADRESMSTEELRRRLDQVREKLGGAARPSIADLRSRDEEEEHEDPAQGVAAGSGSAEEMRGLSSGATLRRRRSLEDTKGSTSKDVSSQLIQRAQELAGGRNKKESGTTQKEESKKQGGGGDREELLTLLNLASGDRRDRGRDRRGGSRDEEKRGRSRKKKKKKGRDKKERKKRRLVNGPRGLAFPGGPRL